MLANLLYNRSKFAKSTPTEISSTETNPDAQRDTNENNRQDTSFLIKKNGYITEKRKDMVTVSVEKDIIRFSLKDVDCDYKPKKFDRITLYCEPQDEGSISDEDVSPLVRKIGIARAKKFTGRVTSVEQNGMGIIDESCIFFWDALASDYNVVTENDLVEADCVQCEFDDDNKYRWRCLNVKFLGEDENLTKKVNNLSMTGITANKHGIEVEDNVVVKLSDLDDTINFTMTVKNTSNDAVECLGGMLLRQGNKLHSQLQLISPTRRQHILLKPGAELKYSFKATSKMYGEASEQFVIKFKSVSIVESFTILRFIRVIVHDSEGKHRTIGTGVNVMQNYAYTHSVLTRNHPAVIPGLPPAASPKFVCVRFENWQVPQKIADVLINSSRAVIYEELAIGFQHLQIDNRSLSISNYSEVFHDLLYLEEFAMNHNIRKYDKRARFIRENGYLAVEIQDVAETRPSLVVEVLSTKFAHFEKFRAQNVQKSCTQFNPNALVSIL